MRVLDLFCSEGGASMGYHLAWPDAEIVGVDIEPQPRYPFTFVQADAMTFDLSGYDFIHGSPPCHDHSSITGRDRKSNGDKGTGWMLDATIRRLQAAGVPWIVENVEGARMPADVYSVRLCGSSFGLDVRRHRLFASNTLLLAPPCDHGWQTPRFVSLDAKSRKAGRLASVVGVHGHCNYAGEFDIRCRAMGIDWMSPQGLTQAIPPAFTRYLAEQFVRPDVDGRCGGSLPSRTLGTFACPDQETGSPLSTGGPEGSASFGHSDPSAFVANAGCSLASNRGRDVQG